MKLRIKLSELLGKHKMTRKTLSELTGIRYQTLCAWYDERIQRLDTSYIEKICEVFDCEISDLLEVVKDNDK